MADDRLAIGLVGCGMIGQVHADGLRKLAEDGEIVAVAAADPSVDARDAVQRNCPFGRMSADPLEVICAPDVDAVMITSPTATHLDLVRAALEAGKPLFCEKPLAPTFADVRAICDAVSSSGLTAQVGFHSRFHPIMNRSAAHGRERGARRADGLHTARRPVLADR